jgi:hypothetical protein
MLQKILSCMQNNFSSEPSWNGLYNRNVSVRECYENNKNKEMHLTP